MNSVNGSKGVLSTFRSSTSKAFSITLKPKGARVLGNKLYTWYVEACTPTMDGLDP